MIPGTCVEDELAVVGDPRIPELMVRLDASGQVTNSSVLVLHSDMSVLVLGPESDRACDFGMCSTCGNSTISTGL